jgi:hypothetical protein
MMSSYQSRILSDESHDFGFVGQAFIHEIVSSCVMLVSIIVKLIGLACTVPGHVIAVAPAVVCVVVAMAIAVLVAIIGAIVGSLAWAIIAAVGIASCIAKRSQFAVFGDDLFGELFVLGREICKHLAIEGCCRS